MPPLVRVASSFSPDTLRLMRREGTLLGTEAPQAPFAPLAPLATGVDTSRPAFRWSNPGAAAYTVAVFDESFTAVAQSPRVAGTSWTPAVELPAGRVNVWQVTAHTSTGEQTEPRPPRPDARFMIIDAEAAATVRAQRARLAGEPLALGILLAEAGLLEDARAELARAANAPATADFARRLLASLANNE